ncbi:SMR family transporter [Vibrio harveyi]|uniref:SMR family transporter n=1 Tax=Vibrio harveyi TaxID=669 RepID=UPI003392817F
MLLARLFLLLAIIAEVAGTSLMNIAGSNEGYAGHVGMYVLISLSYYFLSLTAKKISIGVAYACWEGLGIALITIVSMFYFDSQLNAQELFGLALVVVGVVLVTLGEEHHQPSKKDEHAMLIQPH